MNVSVFIATSLDGFIARPNGDIDWLEVDSASEEDDDFGYASFIQTVDVLVMGRKSYEKVLSFGDWPYRLPVVVLSSAEIQFPDTIPQTVEQLSGAPDEVLALFESRGWNSVYLDGGQTVQRFLHCGLVDKLILTRIPILIGDGVPLFGSLEADVRLRHVATKIFSNGLVQSEYEVVGPAGK